MRYLSIRAISNDTMNEVRHFIPINKITNIAREDQGQFGILYTIKSDDGMLYETENGIEVLDEEQVIEGLGNDLNYINALKQPIKDPNVIKVDV